MAHVGAHRLDELWGAIAFALDCLGEYDTGTRSVPGGHVAQVVCPVCQERNPEFNPRCSSCGATLGSGALSDVADARTTDSVLAPVASPPAIADLTGQTVSHYTVERRLGQGGMGVVYQGTDTLLRRPVALKFLAPAIAGDPRARSRFLREARAASRVDHPNVGTVYEIAEWQDQLFIAMACYEGETLRDRLQRGPLDFREAERIASQIASGLAAAHAAGVVHRDLKPGNVFLAQDGQVKIVDFGLARWSAEADEGSAHLTDAGVVVGTVAYMSPEQARGEAVDHRTDLWSLGVVLYEMVTGASPFEAGNVASTLSRILNVEPPSLREIEGPEVPERLERLTHALLVKDRERRLSNADDVVAALSGAVTLPPAKRRIPKAAFAAAALCAVILAGFVASRSWKSATLPPRTASVVPLPCQVFGQQEFAYLADAVPATLSTVLAQVPDLDTRLPPKRIDVDKLGGDPARVAEAYQVERCVTCTVTATASRLHLAVQVIEPATRRVLWSQEYAGGPDAYLELARQAADGIRAALLPASRAIVTYATLPGGSEAELAFQRGKYQSNRYNNLHEPADFELARASFSRALELTLAGPTPPRRSRCSTSSRANPRASRPRRGARSKPGRGEPSASTSGAASLGWSSRMWSTEGQEPIGVGRSTTHSRRLFSDPATSSQSAHSEAARSRSRYASRGSEKPAGCSRCTFPPKSTSPRLFSS